MGSQGAQIEIDEVLGLMCDLCDVSNRRSQSPHVPTPKINLQMKGIAAGSFA